MEGRGRAARVRAVVGPALGLWWASRVALFAVVTLMSFVLALPPAARIRGTGGWLLERFVWWDAFHFLRIADRGYLPPELPCCDQAFFPGYPFATWTASVFTRGNLVLAGLLVTQVAATVAVVLLWLVAVQPGPRGQGGNGSRVAGDPRVGRVAVLLLAVSPYGIFLSSVYSEALFLALSLGAWLAGLRGRWWWAGALAGAAAATRVNGLFLAAALAVMYLLQLRAQGRWRPRPDVVALAAPFLAVAGYLTYLHHRTGSWSDWQHAQSLSWQRETAWPWQGLRIGWHALVTAPSHDLVVTRALDLVAVLGGLAFTAFLLWHRRWAEAVFLAPNVGVLVASTTLQSAPRYALTWFPLYLMAARWAARDRPRGGRYVVPVTLTVAPPLLAVLSVTFAMHLWIA